MNIGQAAKLSNLPNKTIRYYEDIGLIKPLRAENGYRDYGDDDVHRLKFLQRSRSLGFSIDECRLLLSLYENKERTSRNVKAIASEKITQIDLKISELQSLKATLCSLVKHCHGDNKPYCPIIDNLAGRSIS